MQVKYALEKLDVIVTVRVTSGAQIGDSGGSVWTMTFLSEGGDLPLMTTNDIRLAGSNVGIAVHEIASGTSLLGCTFKLSLVSTPTHLMQTLSSCRSL